MSTFLVSPTEPDPIKDIGRVSSAPERHGVDVLWSAQGALVGAQRKEFDDMLASMQDGRLSKEVAQMQELSMRWLILEGDGQWTRDGRLIHHFRQSQVTKEQIYKFLMTVQSRDIWVQRSNGIYETIEILKWARDWSKKEEHNALSGRPGPKGSSWGRVTNEDYAIHMLTSLPGIGVKTARSILGHFGGVPLKWDVDEDELLEVEGVGKVRAEKMMKVLEAA